MKRILRSAGNSRPQKIACTVSAAALMLGVSQGAVVGLHFQVSWSDGSGPAAYTGFPVTATAFGVPAADWENLTPMFTGYTSPNSGPFFLTEAISSVTGGNGLNPLPNGALNVSWQAVAANTSGYGINDPVTIGPAPQYPYPDEPIRGEQEVYNSFLRDNAFYYTSPATVIGYSVTISGLKSLFTNSHYVVRLAAATDSGKLFTNAIISSLSTTTTVAYSAVFTNWYDLGNAPRNIGVMAGLSAPSIALNDDSITIAGAPAYDGVPSGNQYNTGNGTDPGPGLASTISGLMITDKPIIAYPPVTPTELCAGGNASLTVDAFGVPPLSYQWRKNGQPIGSATTSAFTVNNVGAANAGLYDVVVSNTYGSAISTPAAIAGPEVLLAPQNNIVHDTKPGGTEQNGLNNGATWLASASDGTITRNGVMLFTGTNYNQITLQGATNLQSPTGTVTFWMRTAGVLSPETGAVTPGAQIFTGGDGFDTDNHGISIYMNASGNLIAGNIEIGSGGNISFPTQKAFLPSSDTVADDNWHFVALTFDQTTNGGLAFFIDGSMDSTNQNTYGASSGLQVWTWPVGPAQEISLGLSHKTIYMPFDGELSDFRMYNRILSPTEINKVQTNAIVDTNALQVQLSFSQAPVSGYSLYWTCGSALQSALNLPGPFGDVTPASSPWMITTSQVRQFYRIRE